MLLSYCLGGFPSCSLYHGTYGVVRVRVDGYFSQGKVVRDGALSVTIVVICRWGRH